jgi:hypothetical protein
MMQVVLALTRNILHGEAAGDDFAGRGVDRRQVRLPGIRPVVEHSKGFTIDSDSHHIRFELDLRGQANCRGQTEEDEFGAHGCNISHYQTNMPILFDKRCGSRNTESVMTAPIFALFIAATFALAQAPLPQLRVEPALQSSVLFVKDAPSQPPLTAFLVELVHYPGSYYQLWEDGLMTEPVGPGAEKRIPISNMTVGAVPDYVHLTAAIYADGTSAGTPEKITQLIERRKALLTATRELIGKLQKAKSQADAAGELKQQAEALPALTRSTQNSQPAINQSAAKTLTAETAAQLGSHSVEETVTWLRAIETRLASSKPAL